ncbi:hypothetical protein C8R46DRAFT_1255605 [Mycena filopes]|nr:hypothetical protein C8R46DRAFT_1255605 [Mycena filopes]
MTFPTRTPTGSKRITEISGCIPSELLNAWLNGSTRNLLRVISVLTAMSAPKDTSMASPFASKLGTNYCPLDDEVLQIRALLKAPLSRLKQLDEQITELQKAIDELAEERERVASFVDRHKDLISPFRRLPLDVIQEIFVACLPTNRNCVMTAVEAPVLLGRICSAWRSISLGTPRLWARLHIVEPSRSGPGTVQGLRVRCGRRNSHSDWRRPRPG